MMNIDYWQTFSEGAYYHIYNRAIGNDLLFLSHDNYQFFLKKYQLYMGNYVDTIAFCLMSNHYHFIIRPKIVDKAFLESAQQEQSIVAKRFVHCMQAEVSDALKASDTYISYDDFLVDQFKRLFNSYSAAFNKQQNRTGSLFQRKFKRIQLTSVPRLLNRICYVHHNPIHHDMSPFYDSWRYSSYNIYMSKSPSQLARDLGLSLFAPLSDAPKTPEAYYAEAIKDFSDRHEQFHIEWVKNQRVSDIDDIEGE